MFDEDLVTESIQEIIIEICAVLHRHGYKAVPIGPMMRLMGVDGDRAQQHDQDLFALDQEFLDMLKKHQTRQQSARSLIPKDRTLH